jgi:hypothetical protein
VTKVAQIPKGSKHVKTVRFTTTTAPTLFDLAVAAATVHHDSPRYRLFKRQCYWFADVLLQVLARTYQTVDGNDGNLIEDNYDEVRVPKGMDEEVFARGIEDGSFGDHSEFDNGGKFKIVRIYKAREEVTIKVMKDFMRRREEWEAMVCILNCLCLWLMQCIGEGGVRKKAKAGGSRGAALERARGPLERARGASKGTGRASTTTRGSSETGKYHLSA